MFSGFVIQTRARTAYLQIDNRHMVEGVWCPANHARKRSFVTIEIRNIADCYGNRFSGIQRVCSLLVDLSIHVEDGIRKHFLSSAIVPILRCSVPREMMVVDDVAQFWWEIKKSKRLPFRTSQEVCEGDSERFDGSQDLLSAPDCKDEDRQDDQVQYVMTKTAEK